MNRKQRYEKNPPKWVLALGLLALAGTLLYGCADTAGDGKPTAALSIRPVKTMVLAHKNAAETRSFPGIVTATRETELAFRVGGPLVAFDVNIGERVKQGDVIARIDPRDFEVGILRVSAALDEARANLKAMRAGARSEDIARLTAQLSAAEARWVEADLNYKRLQNLLTGGVIAKARYDNAKTALETARANVDAARQELTKGQKGARQEDLDAAEAVIARLSTDLKAARLALADTRLTAPFDGYINRKYVENYENVKANAPIVSLLDMSRVEVRTAIPEDIVIREADFDTVNCTLDAYPKRPFSATLKEIGRKTDSTNQSYPLTVILNVPEGLIVQPGMAATLTVSLKPSSGSRKKGFMLPAAAVFADSDGHACVWRVDPQTLRVRKVRVTTGLLHNDSLRIFSDLTTGTRVVTAGARFLRENQQVRFLAGAGKDSQ